MPPQEGSGDAIGTDTQEVCRNATGVAPWVDDEDAAGVAPRADSGEAAGVTPPEDAGDAAGVAPRANDAQEGGLVATGVAPREDSRSAVGDKCKSVPLGRRMGWPRDGRPRNRSHWSWRRRPQDRRP